MSSVEKWAKIQEMTQKWASQDELVVCLKLDLKTKKVKYAGPSSMKPFSKDVDVINKFLKYAECTHRDSKAIDVPVAPVGIPNLAIEDINLPNLRKIVPNIVAADVYKRKRVLKGFWGMNCFKPVWYPHDVDFKSPNVNDDKGKRMPRADLEKVLSAYKNYVISSGRTLPLPSTATGTDSGSSEKDMNEHQVTESQEENMDIDDHSVPMDIDNSIPGQSSVQKEENIHKIVSTDAQSAPLPLTSKSAVETQLDALNAVDSWETFSAICQTIDNEITKLPMTPMTFNDLHGVQTHKRYMKISTIPSGYWPVQVKGNGNCFFNSISVLLFGNEDHSSDLRLAALLHGAGHLDHYVEINKLMGSQRSRKRLKDNAVPTIVYAVQSVPMDRPKKRTALQEIQENISPLKKRCEVYRRPIIVDVAVQVSPPTQSRSTSANIQCDSSFYNSPTTDPHTSLKDHGYSQKVDTSLNTAFIQPAEEVDTADVTPPLPDDDPPTTLSSPPDSISEQSSGNDTDPSYVPSEVSTDSEVHDNGEDPDLLTDPKCMVFESCLKSLFARITCTECQQMISPDNTQLIYNGTSVKAKFTCMNGHNSEWSSQPYILRKPAGNLMVAAAILLSGQTFTHISHFADIIHLQFIGKTQYYNIQKDLVIPSIDKYYNLQRDALLQEMQGTPLTLCGDGRCDSPGFSAKYSTYTFMEATTGVIPDFELVQVTETGSSVRMEAEGFRRSLLNLEEAGLDVSVVVTDRHTQIRKQMRTDHQDKNHQFDVWHLSKSLRKKLTKVAAKNNDIKPWIPSICNHLWWSARNAKGNPDLLVELFNSLLHHICNVHTFPGQLVTRCSHAELTSDEVRKKKWFDPGSKSFSTLRTAIMDTRFQKDIRQLSLFCHTGRLETYHSMLLKYCPKRQEFDFSTMAARCQLAVIDNNLNITRGQKTTKDGQPCFATHQPKSTGEWTSRPIYEAKTFQFKPEIIQLAVDSLSNREKRVTPHQQKSLQLPRNIAKKPAPLKEDLIDLHMSRF